MSVRISSSPLARTVSEESHNSVAELVAAVPPPAVPLRLESHHVVLGRYNHEKKTKPLTPALVMYKKVREQVQRGKGAESVQWIKHQTSCFLQEELGYSELPPVSFWVDVHKAKKNGKLEELRNANPQLRTCIDFDGESVVFVQDHQDYYLKADLAGHKKNRNKQNNSGIKSDTKNRLLKHPERKEEAPGTPFATTCIEVDRDMPGATGATVRFQLPHGSSVAFQEAEVDRICCEWICKCSSGSFELINRKTELARTLKSYIGYYRTLLQTNNPCQLSSMHLLQQMNEATLLQVTNTLGNSMIDWFDQYPWSCLPGEANAWNQELHHVQHFQPSVCVPPKAAIANCEIFDDDELEDSVGTFEMSKEEDDVGFKAEAAAFSFNPDGLVACTVRASAISPLTLWEEGLPDGEDPNGAPYLFSDEYPCLPGDDDFGGAA